MRGSRGMLVAAVVVGLAGCGEDTVGIADDVDVLFDWGWSHRPDTLHSPYAAGTQFDMYPTGVTESQAEGWTLVSGDPTVLRVDSTRDGQADVTAVGEGETRVSLVDDAGRTVCRVNVEVRQANGAQLLAYGPEIVGRPDLQRSWDEIQVLVGGAATFVISWVAGDVALHGNGALTARATGDLAIDARRSYIDEDREWLTLEPGSAGPQDVDILSNGIVVRRVRVVGVDESTVDRMELYRMDEEAAESGQQLAVYAQTYDASDSPVFGAEVAWLLDGLTDAGVGDLLQYRYAPHSTRVVFAQFLPQSLEDSVVIHADTRASPSAGSTYAEACTTVGVGAPTSGTAPLGALATLWLLLFDRRQIRRRPLASRHS